MIPARTQRQWGPWKLDKKTCTLDLPYPPEWNCPEPRYWVDLKDCTSSAGVLDVICQIAGKQWATDDVLAGLVRALDDILEPQANLCSCGTDKRISRQVLAKAIRRVKVAPVIPASGSILDSRRRLAPCSLALAISDIEPPPGSSAGG